MRGRSVALGFPMNTICEIETHHNRHEHDATHEHHEIGLWRKYIFSKQEAYL